MWNNWLIIVNIAFGSGIIIGSFLNACIYRIPRNISLISRYRSFCPHCNYILRWWQNIPLLGFIILRGKCYACQKAISYQYPLIEFLSGGLTIWFVYQFGFQGWDGQQAFTNELLFLNLVNYQGRLWFYLLLGYALLMISFIDWQHRIIPNQVLLFLLTGGAWLNFYQTIIPWEEAGIGMLVSSGMLLAARVLGQWFFKKESMGMGDIKLAAVIGFFIGWKLFLLSLFIASCSAVLIALLYPDFRKSSIPFAPFLSIGGIVAIVWGVEIWNGYISLMT